MSEQTSLFPHLKTDNQPKVITEKDARQEAAMLLETLLHQGFVNVHQEDISDEHLKNLIKNLKEE